MLQINLVFLFWIRWWIISSISIFIWWTMETEINSLTDDVANRISLGFWNRDQHRRGVSEILFAKKKKKLKFYFHRPGFFFCLRHDAVDRDRRRCRSRRRRPRSVISRSDFILFFCVCVCISFRSHCCLRFHFLFFGLPVPFFSLRFLMIRSTFRSVVAVETGRSVLVSLSVGQWAKKRRKIKTIKWTAGQQNSINKKVAKPNGGGI